uniref:DUF4371 domain-containing protein n=1 Tax=Sinocyclocheilus grahami TaxID=75366 RepID=A0A672MHT6_SINGR
FAKRNEIYYENCVFQSKWETDYLFTEFKGAPMCLCLETKSKYEKYTGDARTALISDLKGKLHRQQNLFAKCMTVQESSVKASYAVSLVLAKAKKSLSEGEIVKQCAIEHLYFSLVLDESTDVSDVSQLLIFFEVPLKGNFDIQEELLNIASLHGTTKGEDIFKADENTVHEYGCFAKLSAVVTDGAPAMQGKKIRIRWTSSEDSAYGDLLMHTDIRWMSHGKCLERFIALRNEIPLFLEDNVKSDMSDYCCKLRDPEFLCDMAFLTDMTTHLNNLNTQLQGRAQTVSDLYAHMNAFQHKRNLFHNGFSSVLVNLTDFPACEEMRKDAPDFSPTPSFRQGIMRGGLNFGNDYPSPVFTSSEMLCSTYICESSFSTMKHIKSKERNRLTDDTISATASCRLKTY